jgi:hypothetical protein
MHNQPHLFRKRSISYFAAAVLLFWCTGLRAQVDLGLSPMRIDLPGVPGRNVSGSLNLSNGGAVKSRVRVELLDLYIDETTTPQFVADAPSEADYSCRTWLSANPMEMELGAQSHILVRYTIRIPAGAPERSYHCALGFRTLPAPNEHTGPQMVTSVRMIAAFYATVGKPVVSGVIKSVALEPVADGAWRGIVTMENSGSMLYRPIGTVKILDAAGTEVESLELPSFPVLPKREQRFVLPVKTSLVPGPYTLKARVEVGGEIQEAVVAVVAATAAPPAPTPAAETPPEQPALPVVPPL